MKKKLAIYIMLLLATCSLLSCGKSDDKKEDNDKTVDTKQVIDAMVKEAGELPEMSTFTSTDENAQDSFTFLCDLDYEKVEDFIITYSSEAAADEIFIIHVKDKADMVAAKTALDNRIETRKTAFNTYMPSEVSKIENAKIVQSGRYIALVICKQPQSTSDKFLTFFE